MKNKKIKILKRQIQGITLIALVVTIIVLLILAGVALNLTIGQNGIFQRAQDAVNNWRNAETNEQFAMGEMEDWISQYRELERIDGVPIPNGFYYAGGSKATGLVISDNEADKKEFGEDTKNEDVLNTLQGNQFVWVPVENPDVLFTTSEIGVKLNGVNTITNIYSNLTITSGDGYTSQKPGETRSVREPDVLSSYDTEEQYYLDILKFDTTKSMADSFVAEYKAMSDSIKKYKGFYIGRYELTANGEKKGASLTNTNWYNLYKACQNVVQD